jgi:hypothetical protein
MKTIRNVDFRVDKLYLKPTKKARMNIYSDSTGSVIEIYSPISEISFFLNKKQRKIFKKVI